MLCVTDVRFNYPGGAPVVDGLCFTVAAGEVVAIVGRNGAGKSTLLRLLNGLLTPAGGRITVNGASTAQTPVHLLARQIGTVFQAPEQQIFNARVDEEIAFGPRQLGLRGAQLRERVRAVLERVGLDAVAARHPLDLDAAALRFVAIGSVLAMAPPMLLLDEPQRGLDARALARLEALIAEEAAAGTAVLVVCHDMDFVARRATRVLALAGGRIVADSDVTAFFLDDQCVRRAGVDVPDPLLLAQLLDLPPALTPDAVAATWIAHVTRGQRDNTPRMEKFFKNQEK
jgi:energy-coupling factor transport system ATP-binding protein